MPFYKQIMARFRTSYRRKKKKTYTKNQRNLFSIENKRKKSKIKIFLSVAIPITVLSGLIYIMLFSTYFSIEKIKIENKLNYVEKNNIEKHTQIYIGKNLFWIQSEEVEKLIQTKYPEIGIIEAKKKFPKTLIIRIDGAPIIANILNKFGTYSKKLQISSTGMIVTQDQEDAELPYITIKTEKPLELKKQAMSQKRLDFIQNAIKKFEEIFNMNIMDAKYLPIEREVHLRTERNFYLWLDSEKDLDQQLQKLKRAIPKLDIYNLNLEYIDLRIAGTENEKIIYKTF
jgi:cell division septal protein FtsQ